MITNILLYACHNKNNQFYFLQFDSSTKFVHLDVDEQQAQLRRMANDAIIKFYENTNDQLPLYDNDLIKCKLCGLGFDNMYFDLGKVSDLSKK